MPAGTDISSEREGRRASLFWGDFQSVLKLPHNTFERALPQGLRGFRDSLAASVGSLWPLSPELTGSLQGFKSSSPCKPGEKGIAVIIVMQCRLCGTGETETPTETRRSER